MRGGWVPGEGGLGSCYGVWDAGEFFSVVSNGERLANVRDSTSRMSVLRLWGLAGLELGLGTGRVRIAGRERRCGCRTVETALGVIGKKAWGR